MSVLPSPLAPLEPAYENLTDIPDKHHTWNKEDEWYAGNHNGYRCSDCGENSDCIYCTNVDENVDCLRDQAEERNFTKQQAHKRAVQDFDAQMRYYNELRERWGYK